MTDELKKRAVLMKRAALQAGRAITDPKLLQFKKIKVGHQDLLTLGDLESERIIVELIRKSFPEDKIMAEEGSPQEQTRSFAGFVWVIDPIDATVNYSRGRKSSAVSVGLVRHREPVAGAIYNPYAKELFWAVKGKGAFVNDRKIQVSAVKTFKKAICLTDNGAVGADTRRNLRLLMAIPDFERLVITGSAVLHYCEVASGRADFYLHTYLKPWDNAAGFIIVKEAGGIIRSLVGKEIDYFSSEAIVGNPKIIREYLRRPAKVEQDFLVHKGCIGNEPS